MKLISFNVNGLRAIIQKNFTQDILSLEADVICLQETKLQAGQLDFSLPGYHAYYNYAQRKGYSGTAVFTKREPREVRLGMGIEEHDQEGRLLTLDFDSFYLVCCYTPNAQEGLKRLAYRMEWEDAFRAYLKKLNEEKGVVLCGDLNVAHQEIDLKNPKTNVGNPGFTPEERGKMTELLAAGFTDTFRYFYPEATDQYSWWSYRFHARDKNVGWRIDYFIVSDDLKPSLVSAGIHQEIFGSDHCPVELVLSMPEDK
ncbi:MAG: exodeoxyribonuclease III [Clostridia bacterium]|nr:exodeoxyribonuclease III [Clostridia bacterium]